MKKLFIIWFLSTFCLSLIGCGQKNNEGFIDDRIDNNLLLKFAAQALPCDEWTSFANFALLWTWVNRQGNLMYYWVDEVVWYEPDEDWNWLKSTCYRIAPVAMEIHQSDKWFKLVDVEAVEDYEGGFLIEDYKPEFDGWKLDEAVEKIFSPEAFAVWQQRDYWEYFTDYNDIDRKSFEERAIEYFKISTPENEDFVSYYDNWAIREVWPYIDWKKQWFWFVYDEKWNVINVQTYENWELIEDKPKSNVLSVKEEDILSTDELKKICEEQLKEIEPNNPKTTWTEEKLFINTYGFRWYTASDWIHNGSHTYCNITLDWIILTYWFTTEASIDELHLSDFGYAWWIGNDYPNLKEYYWFVWDIVLGNRFQTTYIQWINTMYFDNSRWIALKLWAEFDEWLIREIDTDEGWIPHSEIIFLVKWDENEENRTGINWYREMFTIVAISKENLENFWASIDSFDGEIIWQNNQYYFVETNIEWAYSDLLIFDVEEY